MHNWQIIKKYTGTDVSTEELYLNQATQKLAIAIDDAEIKLNSTENKLRDSARLLRETAEKIEANLDAQTGDQVSQLNSLGELQNDRTDALIALRAEQIETLNHLVRLQP